MGIVLGTWLDDFTRAGWVSVALVTVLGVVAWLLDYAAGLMGAQREGASRQAMVGAAGGQYMAEKDHNRALKVGIMAGMVVIVFMMIGFFVVALVVRN